MRIDFGRLIIFLVIAYLGQIVIQKCVLLIFNLLGWHNYLAMLFIVDILVGFLFAYLYYPKEYRRGIFRNPNFYRDAAIFALIFIGLDLVF